jgi:hypothetical protein
MTIEIPESRLTLYQTPNSFKEVSSVKWLDNLFCREDIKANFSVEDKKPDIDGTFDIIKNYRFAGRLEVQIKTYNAKSSNNKHQYLCDIKVLYYALKNRISCVLLFVVDPHNNKAYWKYLSISFIQSLNLKTDQQKITIRFNEEEYVDAVNFPSCLEKWYSFYTIKNNGIFFDSCSIEESIENKKRIDKFLSNTDFSNLNREDVICIQNFIDRFNHLLDGDYNFIKRFYYPKMWKLGIAIGNFSSNSLSYGLYPISYGMNDLIFKKVKLDNFSDVNDLYEDTFIGASFGGNQNPIIDGSTDIPMKYINEKIKDLIEGKKFLFLTPEICTEYIFDAIKENNRSWKINYQDNIILSDLKEFFETNYHSQIKNDVLQPYFKKKSEIVTIYQCIIYLLNNDIKEITNLYPVKPTNDEFYIDYIFSKLKIIYTLFLLYQIKFSYNICQYPLFFFHV